MSTAAGSTGDHMEKFVVGAVYENRAVGDHEIVYKAKCVARTAKTATFKFLSRGDSDMDGRRAIHTYQGVEYVKFGSYRWAPHLYADRRARRWPSEARSSRRTGAGSAAVPMSRSAGRRRAAKPNARSSRASSRLMEGASRPRRKPRPRKLRRAGK